VLNAAVSSYSPLIHYRKAKWLLEDVGLQFDEAVVFVDHSDIADEMELVETSTGVVEKRFYNYPKGSWKLQATNWIANRVPAVWKVYWRLSTCVEFGCAFSGGGVSPPTDDRMGWMNDSLALEQIGPMAFARAEGNLNRLLALLQHHSIPLRLAFYPWPRHIYIEEMHPAHATWLRRWSTENKVVSFDLYPAFFGDTSKPSTERMSKAEVLTRFFIAGDIHWNREGHAFVADRFLEWYPTTLPMADPKDAKGRVSPEKP